MKDLVMAFLSDLLVVDITSAIVGPACTLRFAELGAEVVKIEPRGGDIMRRLGGASPTGLDSPTYIQFNKGKRSLGLDLATPEGKDIVGRLLERADVFVSNLRPAALAKLDLGYEAIKKKSPEIVYCLITGFGTGGPYDGLPAYDSVVQAATGISGLFMRRDGKPSYVPSVICDHVVGEIAFGAVVAALFNRERRGGPVQLEIPMFEYMSAFVLKEHLGQRVYDGESGNLGDPRLLDINTAPIQTLDGWISMSINTDRQFASFVDGADRAELKRDDRFSTVSARIDNMPEWLATRNEIIGARTTAEWLEICRTEVIPAMPCNSLDDLMEDPQIASSGLLELSEHREIGPVLVVKSPLRVDGRTHDKPSASSPLGSDSEAVLERLGFSKDEINRLKSERTIFT